MPSAMGRLRVWADLGLVRQGISIGWRFGADALEEMGRVAELLERSVYEAGSLHRAPGGVAFTWRNPPLRMGAFRSVRATVDGAEADAARATVWPGRAGTPVPFRSVTPERPLVLPIGERTDFFLPVDGRVSSRPTVRVELRSVAIPPLVWYEFRERLTGAA